MSLPRHHRQLYALCLLLVAIALALSGLAPNASAEIDKRQTEPVEVAFISDAMLQPARAPVDAAPRTEEAQSDKGEHVFVVGHARGQCWKLPARATLAAFVSQDAGELFRRPTIFWMDIKSVSVPAVIHARALRPVCLMPLPFTPDMKNAARQLATMRQPIFRAF